MAGAGSFMQGMAGGMQAGMSIQRQQQELAERADAQRAADEAEAARQQEEFRLRQQQQSQAGQPQQGMSVNPAMIQQFMPSSGAAAGGSSSAGSAAGGAGAAGSGSAAGGSSAASSSFGSAAAAAGPWAALAAVIAVNEKSARNGGHRRDGSDYAKDLALGKVVEQDSNRFSDKIFGENDKTGLGSEMKAAGNFATLDFKNGVKDLGKGVIGRTIKKIF